MYLDLEYQYAWFGRFLVTWDTGNVEIGFYDKHCETELWSISKGNLTTHAVDGASPCPVCGRPRRQPWCKNCEGE